MANFVSNDNATSLMNAINQKKDSKPSTITWAEWIALTDEQREGTHYIITNVPARFSDKDAVFSIKNQTLTFTNKTATVTDSRITTDTYIFTFYHDQAVAQAAGIECSWTTGTVTFTVDDDPSESIVVDILCILPALATPPSEGGGHTIEDQDGTALTQQPNMKFADSFVTNDSVGEATVVENIKEHTTASDYENATEDGIHVIDDGNDVPIGASSEDKIEVTGDGVKTLGQLLNAIYNDTKFDITKITKDTKLVFGTNVYFPTIISTDYNFVRFTRETCNSSYLYIEDYTISSSSVAYATTVNGSTYSRVDDSSTVEPNGLKLTLYYGTSSTVINLKTDANYCQYDSNTSVKQKINTIPIIKSDTKTGTTTAGGILQQIDESWRPIISASVDGGNNYIIELYKGTSYWAGRVIDYNGNLVANTSVTITYYYL